MKEKEAQAAKNPSRRQILGGIGLVGAGVALGACTPALGVTPTKPDIDVDILNFALNLEYLEAAFYLAAVGRVADIQAIGGSAAITLPSGFDGTKGIAFTDSDVQAYAQEIAQDELNHVKFLAGALGSAAVQRPALNLSTSFSTAGSLASGGKITNFNPYAGDLFFLHGAYIFEDVGVTAYKGAAAAITSATYLTAAAGILAVEAYHAGEIRTLLYKQRATVAAGGLNVAQITAAISALRKTVGNGPSDMGVTVDGSATGTANIVLADSNSIVDSRTTDDVLNIVYLDGTKAKVKGGFFPNGLNGNIK